MPESIEKKAVQIALAAVDRNKQLKDVAQFLKHEMDKNFPASGKATEGVYHCVVGKSFSSKFTERSQGQPCRVTAQSSRSHTTVMLFGQHSN